jgi:hypothetical protein
MRVPFPAATIMAETMEIAERKKEKGKRKNGWRKFTLRLRRGCHL